MSIIRVKQSDPFTKDLKIGFDAKIEEVNYRIEVRGAVSHTKYRSTKTQNEEVIRVLRMMFENAMVGLERTIADVDSDFSIEIK